MVLLEIFLAERNSTPGSRNLLVDVPIACRQCQSADIPIACCQHPFVGIPTGYICSTTNKKT